MSELLLPVGNMEMALAAIHNGADAIYLGFPHFNARGRSQDFEVGELAPLRLNRRAERPAVIGAARQMVGSDGGKIGDHKESPWFELQVISDPVHFRRPLGDT